MTTLRDYTSIEEDLPGDHPDPLLQETLYRAGQTVWWIPSDGSRPAIMTRTQRMLPAVVKSYNSQQRTCLIEHQDVTRTTYSFLVQASELTRREIPR